MGSTTSNNGNNNDDDTDDTEDSNESNAVMYGELTNIFLLVGITHLLIAVSQIEN